MSGLEDMIHTAELDLGLGEPNKIQKWYRDRNGPAFAGNFAWCDASITFWAWNSDNQGAVTFGGDFALTTAHAKAFKNHSQWHVDVAGIRRGDIVFFDWDGTDIKARIDHVGLVTGVSGSKVYTIEGNYSNKCGRHTRMAATIAGYGRPSYVHSTGPRTGFVTFPGKSFFAMGRRSPIIAAMHDRLVAVGCNKYETQTNKDVWGTGDLKSYSAWQKKLGFQGSVAQPGSDADGIPGKQTWDKLKVPRT
ncbi:peptidoglycan-binding protein [Kribbella sp. C-35]|uniref:peptidoglycan-binding protein n=1 Tax=Kribbella sp. C-35 TaxID=2789276 RepID=UPI00397CD6DE